MPFFRGEDPTVVMELAFCMERCYVGPSEDVITVGDVGREMFFILEGVVEVLVRVGQLGTKVKYKRVSTMGKGQFFGEMSLVEANHARTATIRTITFCELRSLSADAFLAISDRFADRFVLCLFS